MNEFETKKEEFFNKYKVLSLEEKLNVIAKSFNCSEGHFERRLCRRKWRGYTDMFISFSDNLELYIGTRLTPDSRKKTVQKELVDAVLAKYNPEIVEYCEEIAWNNLKKIRKFR